MLATLPLLEATDFPAIRRRAIETLQINLGYKCNQRCLHCHVNAGPTRTEMMSDEMIDLIPEILTRHNIRQLDLTGGAPEIHHRFRDVVRAAHALGVQVIDRCNLTILFEPGHEDTAAFLAEHNVTVVASMQKMLISSVAMESSIKALKACSSSMLWAMAATQSSH